MSDLKSTFFTFDGRLNRWKFFKYNAILWIIGAVLQAIAAAMFPSVVTTATTTQNVPGVMGVILGVWGLVTAVASISLACRRLHDLNCSGWWQLLPIGAILIFIFAVVGISIFTGVVSEGGSQQIVGAFLGSFLLGWLALFIFNLGYMIFLYCIKGTEGPNKYGEDPLAFVETNL